MAFASALTLPLFVAAALAPAVPQPGTAPVLVRAQASVSVEIVRAERVAPTAPPDAIRRTLRIDRNPDRGGAFVEFE